MTSGMIGWSLTAVSVGWGLFTYWVFRRFTDRVALRRMSKHLYAHLLEIRLFSEEPALVWNAQKALVVDNLRFLALLARPVLIMALPFAFLYGQFDSIYGRGPLEIGHSAVVTLKLPGEATAGEVQYTLVTPAGIAVETPSVVVMADNQISWRIQAVKPARGSLRFVPRGVADEVSIPVAAGERTLSSYRRRESLPGGFQVEVDYPKAGVVIAGLSLPWLAWLLTISTACAGLLAVWPRRRPRRKPLVVVQRGSHPKRDYVTVVSGIPRSGTSLMMRILDAGGIPALTDKLRAPDLHNPHGYFEYGPVKRLAEDSSWMPAARGKSVKIIYSLLPHLPHGLKCRIIFMERDLTEVFDSQSNMLRAHDDPAAEQDRDQLIPVFAAELRTTREWLAQRPEIPVLNVPYAGLVGEPLRWAREIARFLDGGGDALDLAAMAAAVDPSLYRHHGAIEFP